MDYHSMTRRELQALCKEHNIPANSANSVLADKLSELLNENQIPLTRRRTCMKSSVETIDESEPAVSRRQAKKVRFSPNNELVEYELRSGKKETAMVTEIKRRGKSVAKKVDNDNIVQLIDDGDEIPVKLTRSRVQILGKDCVIPINERKQGRRAVKDVVKGIDAVKDTEVNLGKVTRSKVHRLGKGGVIQLDENKQSKQAVKNVEKASESIEETVVSRVRVTRSKAQTLMEDGMGPDLNPQVKKKSGRRVAKDAENVEPSKEILGIPARVTRSRGQTLKDYIGNTVAKPQAEKKRTRREAKVTDLSNNSSNVAPEDNQELPKRKLLRTRRVENANEDGGEKLGHGRRKKKSKESIAEVPESQYHAGKGSKQSRKNVAKIEDSTVLNQNVSNLEMVNDRKVTRSKAHLAMKSSERSSKSKTGKKIKVQQLVEPLEHAGRKNVNRRKSVMQPENTEVVLHLEEPVDRPARKDTRRNFFTQKSEGKGIDNPFVGKREMVKEIEMVKSPNVGTRNTVGKKQSEEKSGNLSMIDEGLEDKENVTISGKNASENEMNAVASATGSHKSRKRRGDPIIEDQTIETKYTSPVDESPRRSKRSASKSEGKAVMYPPQHFVAKKQQDSSLKTPTSRMDNQSAVESAFSKLGNSELYEKVTETESTPAIDEFVRRVTRSAIKSERNAVGNFLEKVDRREPSRSAIEEQPIGDAQLSSRKVAKFRTDPAVNKTPRRFTRSGIKHGGNTASKLFEKVDKKQQPSQSAHQGQPLDDAQISSPEVTDVRPNPDDSSSRVTKNSNSRKRKKSPVSVQKTIQADTIGVQSEISKEAKAQILEHSADLLASESVRLSTKDVEENKISMNEAAIVMENVSFESGEKASEVESHAISDGSCATARTLEKKGMGVALSGRSSIQFTCSAAKYETNATPYLTENLLSGKQQSPVDLPNFEDGSPSGTNLSDIRTPFLVAEVAETAADALSDGSHVQNRNQEVSEKSVLKSARPEAYKKEMEFTKSRSWSERLQPDVMVEEPVVSVGKTVLMEESVDIWLGVITKGNNDTAENNCDSISYEAGSSALCHAAVQQSDVKSKLKEMEALLEPSITEGAKQFLAEDGVDAQIEKGSEQDVLTCKDTLQSPYVGKHEVADDGECNDEDEKASARAQKQLMDEPVTEVNRVHGSIQMLESPDIGNRDVADGVNAREMDTVWGSSTSKDVCQSPVVGEHDVEPNRVDALEKSTGDDELQGLAMDENDIKDDIVTAWDSLAEQSEPSTGKNNIYGLAMGRLDVADDGVDAGKEPTKSGCEVVPSTGKYDGEDGSVNATKECESDSHASTYNIPVIPALGSDVADECNNANKELEHVSKASIGNDKLETPAIGKLDDVDDKSDGQDRESEQERLTSNDSPAIDKRDVGGDGPEPGSIENLPVVPEVLIRSFDQEPESVLNVADDIVPCDTVDECVSVGRSDSSTSIETPQTLATSGNNVTVIRVDAQEESILNSNEGAVSNNLGDIDGLGNAIGVMDTQNDVSFCMNEQKIKGTSELDEDVWSKEIEKVSPDMSNEQRTEEAETTTENDHALGDKKGQMVATVDHDLDRDKFVDDISNHGVDELDSQLVGNTKAREISTREESSPIVCTKEESAVDDAISDRVVGDIGADESPITEESLPITYKKESHIDDTVSDPPTFFKDDDRNKQDGTQNAGTSVDWGNYSFGIDGFQKPVSANKSDDVLGRSTKDDLVLDLQTSARAGSSIEESSSLAADLVYSVTNMEKASRIVTDGKSNQDVDVLKANVDVTEEFFDWPEDPSLKALFTTPTTTRISHVKDGQEDAVRFAFPDNRCEDIGRNGTAEHDFHHQWENKPLRVFNGETQGTAAGSPGLSEEPENEVFGVPNFEDFSRKYFDDKEVDGSSDMSGKNEHFDFKEEQVNEIKQYGSLSEAAGTSHHDASGLKDNSIRSGQIDKTEETQLKGSETGDDVAFDKGI